MKVIIAGSRNYSDYKVVRTECNMLIAPGVFRAFGGEIEIVSGSCDRGVHTFTRKDGTKVYGVDGLGEKYAEEYGFSVKYFPADWGKNGKSAGPIRNSEMAKYADALIAFPDTNSKGTIDMITKATKIGRIVFVINCY